MWPILLPAEGCLPADNPTLLDSRSGRWELCNKFHVGKGDDLGVNRSAARRSEGGEIADVMCRAHVARQKSTASNSRSVILAIYHLVRYCTDAFRKIIHRSTNKTGIRDRKALLEETEHCC
eukprot:scaffold5051_cov105-Skeletonema_dohrnii-CCMP3373.AAC.1